MWRAVRGTLRDCAFVGLIPKWHSGYLRSRWSSGRRFSGHGRRPHVLLLLQTGLVFVGKRRRVSAFWNISHNVGGRIVAPIIGAALRYWAAANTGKSASYIVPACVAVILLVIVLVLGKGSPQKRSSLTGTNDAGRKVV